MCTFSTFNSLKVHLSRTHSKKKVAEGGSGDLTSNWEFHCPVCDFKQPFVERDMFIHLRGHLRLKEIVPCPFRACTFTTNVYSTYNAHKCREHKNASDYDVAVVVQNVSNASHDRDIEQDPAELSENENEIAPEAGSSTEGLTEQLQYNLASFFLKMQTILHVSQRPTQEIIEHIDQLFSLTEPVVRESVTKILEKHNCPFTDALVSEIVQAVSDSNILYKSVTSKGPLSTAKRRKSYYEEKFLIVKPVEYLIESSQRTFTYVPILTSLQMLLKKTDVCEKIQETTSQLPGQYLSHCDGSYYQENALFSSEGQKLSIILYVDDFEIANPLGTSKEIHKVCAVFWTLANLPVKSALHSIQLALLCNSNDVRQFGFAKVFAPLLSDLKTLEEVGVYIETFGDCLKGTVYSVAADNLAAHGLAGFNESFRSTYFCRFCLATKQKCKYQMLYLMRTKDLHDKHVQEIQNNDSQKKYGVKQSCVLSDHLSYFHPITGFPPEILHDLFECVVPVELAHCLKGLIAKKYFTLEELNRAILSFPFQHSDKVDRSHPIPPNVVTRGTIGGNGHENHTLLRLLPVLIGSRVPEGDTFWEVLMNLKDIVELAMSHAFTDDIIQYMSCKISDHRQLLQEVLPSLRLRPKHHYIEHYPHLIKCFGPLVHLWTMRFEGKHKVFKIIIRHTHNYKNVLKTLAERNQNMMAFNLSSPRFFKPPVQTLKVESVYVESLPTDTHALISSITDSSSLYGTKQVTIEGTTFVAGMFVCTGAHAALPQFKEIRNILLIRNDSFLLKDFETWYIEHLRSYELTDHKSHTCYVTGLPNTV
ncbi:hypothetical protein N1851_020018 [Merluccius polli]|uniref:C2H2-type domain-containing protein n=1 Tax=Merluccius polli TaxID=89951 RepID=A0AA47MKZ8_MERPO|nr:hypothetical protein N1851_020018 [Merluccius polli]